MNRLINSTIFPDFFSGTNDEFLAHCLSKDSDAVETEVTIENTLCDLMKTTGMDRELATQFIHDIQMEYLCKKGYVEVVGSDDDGQPIYEITEAGKKVSEKEKWRKLWDKN